MALISVKGLVLDYKINMVEVSGHRLLRSVALFTRRRYLTMTLVLNTFVAQEKADPQNLDDSMTR